MTRLSLPRLLCLAALTLAGGCSALRPAVTPQPAFYALDSGPVPGRAVHPAAPAAPALIVNPSRAASGFDSPRIIYTRAEHQLEYFAHSEWVDTPARMLGPLLVAALERSGSFGSVALTPGTATGDLRLDTEILKFQQEFGLRPSQVHFVLRAYLVDNRTRRVLASREFDGRVAATSEDAYGGVGAANVLVQDVLVQLAAFCADAARNWQPRVADDIKQPRR